MSELRVWAPNARRVRAAWSPAGRDVRAGHVLDLVAEGGWWSAELPDDELDYGFLLDDDLTVLPDPRSRRQPFGVHGPSRTYFDTYEWHDNGWVAPPLQGAVIYELHLGTFSEDGTCDAAIEHLDHLVDLGVTHVELLPVNAVNGVWNWGYDGVLWYAVHEPYGGPDALKRLVDACHQAGLGVLLDVVYNHLGASGNYLPRFGPYLAEDRNTWGAYINLESREVRDYIIENALQWLTEFHIDGLRLDAVHALRDPTPTHILAELSQRVAALDKPKLLIAESDLNDPVMITPAARGGLGMDGQWDDDVHHALHALLTGERQGYYCDFGSLEVLAKVLTHAFLHDGTFSTFRSRVHGKPVDPATTSGDQFVVCLQDHDQVGNRAAGDRLSALVSTDLLKVGATLLLTSPFTPMLWMGEEWAASTPWPFFTSHPEPDLAEATRQGRLEEFAEHGWDPATVADPQDPATFFGAKLRWDELEVGEHAEVLATYRTLLALRRQYPELADPSLDRIQVSFDESAGWIRVQRGRLEVVANLGKHSLPLAGDLVFATCSLDSGALPPQAAAVVSQ